MLYHRQSQLAIYKILDERTGKLRDALQVESQAAIEAQKGLQEGPKTSLQKSRLTATGTRSVTIEREG